MNFFKLIGSEKQIEWAKEIIESGLETISANIEANEERMSSSKSAKEFFAEKIELFKEIKSIVDNYYAELGKKHNGEVPASFIIKNRFHLDGNGIIKLSYEMERRK